MRRPHRQDYPELSADDWYAVADAWRIAESAGEVSLISRVTGRLKSAIGLRESAPTQIDARKKTDCANQYRACPHF